MEKQIQQGQQWLATLLKLMGVATAVGTSQIENHEGDLPDEWLIIDPSNLTSEQIAILVGERGEAIDAIQYLTNTVLNMSKEPNSQKPFTVELNGYRVRRRAQLQELAEKVAQQVRETGKEVELKSLSSAERRQVHTFLKDSQDLETESRGQEPDRRLVVRLR